MDYENKIEIPFGAYDSELYYQEIIIPEGFEAIIQDGKVILRKKESEDEKIRKAIIRLVEIDVEQKPAKWSEEDETVLNNLIYALANDRIGNNRDEYVDWLKALKLRMEE